LEFRSGGKNHIEKKEINRIMKDAAYAIDVNYKRKAGKSITEVGYFYKAISENKEMYLHKDETMLNALRSLRSQGKTLFLVTDSNYEYVDMLMSFSYGSEWKDIFDFIVIDAKKAHFFGLEEKPFRKLEISNHCRVGSEVRDLDRHAIYTSGSAKYLEKILRNSSVEAKDERILYLGDNCSHDILPVLKLKGWDCVCILEELGKLDLGNEYDGRFWGDWRYEETPKEVVPSFWCGEMMKKANMVTDMVSSQEMLDFYAGKEVSGWNSSSSPVFA
jgi:HAD superfamily 5'-nucleotidase-like hydrolase